MNEEFQAITKKVRYATIATTDNSGRPWAAPVWYVNDDTNIYWWSSVASQHSKNIEYSPDVYITIFDSSAKEGEGVGLYIRAKASIIDDYELEKVTEMYNATTSIFKLENKDCSGQAPTRLYKAVVSEMWINRGKEDGGYYEDFRERIS